MSTPLVVFPDVEAALTGYLRGALAPGPHVGTEWPEDLLDWLDGGVVSLSRGGGATHVRLVLDEPVIDVDVLAANKGLAQDLVQLVRAHLAAAEGTTIGDLHVYRVDDMSLVWLPWLPAEGTATVPRYVLSLRLRVRPAA